MTAVAAALVLLPVAAGLGIWTLGDGRARLRAALALGGLAITAALAVFTSATTPSTTFRWGNGLHLLLTVDDLARAPLVLVPVVGFMVVTYALGYGRREGRARMVGLLVAFVGTMELVLLAGDLLTLIIGWELVGLISWGLIAHHWRTDGPPNATHAYLATRAGDLGLVAAAGAAFAAAGTMELDRLPTVGSGWAHLAGAGLVLAAFAKSAQLPFSPWLFSAMAGPTPASALLHSATMVAAGAYLLARVHPFLDGLAWFAPVAIGVGLATALAGGAVAFLQSEAKKLLAASTSAHYGLMIVAVGAGYPNVAVAHLVAHGLFKVLLFVAAGVAITESGTGELPAMRLGGRLPLIAGFGAVGALALAGVPPLGAARTKEQVIAAAAHAAPWLAVLVVAAGGLSALYAIRFFLLAYGPSPPHQRGPEPPISITHRHPGAVAALALSAAATVALGAVWVPWGEHLLLDVTGGRLPAGATWEVVASLAAVVLAAYGAMVADRRGRLALPAAGPVLRAAAGWGGLRTAAKVGVVDPVLRAAALAGRFDDRILDAPARIVPRAGRRLAVVLSAGDDRVVDGAVRRTAAAVARAARLLAREAERAVDGAITGLARLTGALGGDARRLQSGQVHHYYAGIAVVLALLVTTSLVWR